MQTADLMQAKHYKANLTAGALLVPESRKIAALLMSGVDKKHWIDAIENQNILQKRSRATAIRTANLIRARLKLMKPTLWKLVKEGDSEVATHAVLAATIKYSPLLGDYLDTIVRSQFKRFEERLSYRLWEEYIQQCMQRDPSMPEFPESTAQKVKINVHRILRFFGASAVSGFLERGPIFLKAQSFFYFYHNRKALSSTISSGQSTESYIVALRGVLWP